MDTAKEILRKQLELLAEAATKCAVDELVDVTHAMVEVYYAINEQAPQNSCGMW